MRRLNIGFIKSVQERTDKSGDMPEKLMDHIVFCKRHLEENVRAETNSLDRNNHCLVSR